MCDVCCKELRGWSRAFTGTERALTILEALLLVILFVFLIFLILHLIACADSPLPDDETKEVVTEKFITQQPHFNNVKYSTTKYVTSGTTMDPERECSWTPSDKTEPPTHYYENNGGAPPPTQHTPTTIKTQAKQMSRKKLPFAEDFTLADQSDGEDADEFQKQFVFALVKLRPPQEVVFGCILSAVSAHWALTAASCLEAVEEVDSLDSFVMMAEYGGGGAGRVRAVRDVRIHPLYQGTNKTFDLAALRSEGALGGRAVPLPAPLHHALLAPGERFHVLGFGPYRSIDRRLAGRGLRAARVWRLSSRMCPGAAAWALRHLSAGRALPGAPCAAAWPLCAGPLYGRAAPCTYCAGAPLLRRGVLLGVMADNPSCGMACEPQLFVNIAALKDWLDSILD